MSKPPLNQLRARRLDRVMSFVISSGGLLIIGAVLAMLLFIAKEAMPLFGSAKSRFLGTTASSPAQGLWLEESGKAGVLLSPTEGLRVLRLPSGEVLTSVEGGPSRPWRAHTRPDAKGEFLAIGADGRLSLARMEWGKPAGEADPARWSLAANWLGKLPIADSALELLHFRVLEGGGLGGGGALLRVVALGREGLLWFEAPLEAQEPIVFNTLPIPAGLRVSSALWSPDGASLFVGTSQGELLNIEMTGEPQVALHAAFGEPIRSLGFALGQSTLLVGGEQGKLAAYQRVRVDEVFQLQEFHTFPRLQGPVLGFFPSQRDKRFLAWTPQQAVVDHLTTEQRLFSARLEQPGIATLAPRGDLILHASGTDGALRQWSLDAPHPEVNAQVLLSKTHYEGYARPTYVWQSTGGTDDFEPKFSLIPLIFGTMKGTFYAMLFAFPLAVLGALYTSQFASPRLRNTIKPAVEVMAALPSVVLGFLAGLIMAPLLERMAMQVVVFPFVVLLVTALCVPLWSRLPRAFKGSFGDGREVIWMVPVLLLAVYLSGFAGPWVERTLLGGSYRTWLQTSLGVTYDQRNSIVVGFAMGFAVIPIIFTISEDAISSVPKSLTSASLACGASPWQTAWRVVLPTASPGIFSASMVGLGRAIGETMIVLMATGNTPVMDWSPFNGMRTLSANIAVEIPEAPLHGSLYRVLFLAAFLLFLFTFLLNTAAELVRQRLRKRYESI